MGRATERPLLTNYLLFPTKTNFKTTTNNYEHQKQSFEEKVIINYEHNYEHFKKMLLSVSD